MNGHDFPEQFDSQEDDLRNDPDYQRWSDARDVESTHDFLTGAMVRNLTSALDMLDEAMRKR